MSNSHVDDLQQPTRRAALLRLGAASATLAVGGTAAAASTQVVGGANASGSGPPALGTATGTVTPTAQARALRMTVFIRYQIDPFQRDDFRKYAETWGPIIPRCGGHLLGYFLPSEGTNDIAWGLIAFESLAAYEAYRARLKTDPDARANFAFAVNKRLVLREERTFLENVPLP